MFSLPGMITCNEFEDFILAYLDDELPRSKRRVFDWHIRLCKECREYLAAYLTSLELTKKAMAADEATDLPAVPDDLVTAVMEARKTS
jgi:anti-sigma factor RsiW